MWLSPVLSPPLLCLDTNSETYLKKNLPVKYEKCTVTFSVQPLEVRIKTIWLPSSEGER